MENDNLITPSYWLLSDDRLPLCNNPDNYELFKSHLKHSILFNPIMIVPDSCVINNLNFRRSIRNDESIQSLVSDQIIKVAVRENSSTTKNTLVNVRNEMLTTVKPEEFTNDEYCQNHELELLDRSSEYIYYSITDIAKRYTELIRDIFSGEKSKLFLKNEIISEEIKYIIMNEIEREGKIGRAFFYYELEKHLEEKDWNIYKNKILDLANAPYLTALPYLVGADPVYSNEHKGAFDIISGRIFAKSEKINSVKFSSKLGLHSFVAGLSLLDRESILSLMDSDEASEYYAQINSFSDASDKNIIEIQNSLKLYQLRIEDEIIKNHYYLKNRTSNGNEKIIENNFYEVSSVIGTSLTFLTTAFSSLSVLSPLSLLFTKPVTNLITSAFHQKETTKEQYHKIKSSHATFIRDVLIDEFTESCRGRVLADGIIDKSGSGKEILYK